MTTENDATVKLWSKETWVSTMQKTPLGHCFNRGAVYFPEEFLGTRARGDEVSFDFVDKLTNVPLSATSTLEGNEEALDIGNFKMAMNTTRIGVKTPNKDTIEQQRTNVNFEKVTLDLEKRRAAELLDASLWNQLAGFNTTGSFTLNGTTYNSASDRLHVTGHNVPVAPSTNRIIRPGTAANDQSLTSSDKMSFDFISYALEKNDMSDQPIEMFDDMTYDLYLSPLSAVDLMQDSSSQFSWSDLQLAKIEAGRDNEAEDRFKNDIVCLGRYLNVNIYQVPRIPNGVSSADSSVVANTKRNVLVGRNAVSFASPYGGRPSDTDVPIRVSHQLDDYEYWKGTETRMIYGLKKMAPSNGEDIGVMVLSTYAATHA
jgi:hypothetical protein